MAVYIRERSPNRRRNVLLMLLGLLVLSGLAGGMWWLSKTVGNAAEVGSVGKATEPSGESDPSNWFRRLFNRGSTEPLLEPLPQDPLIQVFFNHSQAAQYTEPYREIERSGDDLEQVIIAAIQSAEVSVDMAVQELRLPGIAAALRERHQAGVRVRVILENSYRRPLSAITPQEVAAMEERDRHRFADSVQIIDSNLDGQLSPEEIAENDALIVLQNAGIPILDDRADGSAGSGLMHHKFVVVDDRLVILGSANFTSSDIHGDFLRPDSRGNANHLLRIDSSAIARIFAQEFALMWGDGVGGAADSLFGLQKPLRAPQTINLTGSTVYVQFSPTSPSRDWWQSGNGFIGRVLSGASQQVDLALFVFSDQNLSSLLEERHQIGVSVRALIDEGFIYRSYSEGLDMLGITLADHRCRIEEANEPWEQAIATVGTPTLPEGDMLHHKFAVIDRRIVITGSQNWSNAANHNNDENIVVIHNPTVAAHFQREFDRLYNTAALGIPVHIQEKMQAQQTQCNL